ncbi:unnamed protein product, partial [Laminaria digitata]
MMTPANERRRQPTRATSMASRHMLTACLLLLAARSRSFYLGPSAAPRGGHRNHQSAFSQQLRASTTPSPSFRGVGAFSKAEGAKTTARTTTSPCRQPCRPLEAT